VISGLNVSHIDSCRGSVCTDALLSMAQSASVAQHDTLPVFNMCGGYVVPHKVKMKVETIITRMLTINVSIPNSDGRPARPISCICLLRLSLVFKSFCHENLFRF